MNLVSVEKYQDYKSWMVVFRAGILITTGLLESLFVSFFNNTPLSLDILLYCTGILSLILGVVILVPSFSYRIRELWWLVPALLHPFNAFVALYYGFVFPIAVIFATGVLGNFILLTTSFEKPLKVVLSVYIGSAILLYSFGIVEVSPVLNMWYIQLAAWLTFILVSGLFVWSIQQEAKFSRRDILQKEFVIRSLAQLRSTTLHQVQVPFEELKQEFIIQNALTELPKVLGEKMRILDHGITVLSRLHQKMESISMNAMVKMLNTEFTHLKTNVEVFRNDKSEDFANVYLALQAFLGNSKQYEKSPELEIKENAYGKVFVLKCYGLGVPSDWMENIDSINVGQDVVFNMAIWIQLLTAQGFFVGISSESGIGRTIAFAKEEASVKKRIATNVPHRFFDAKLAPIID